MNKLGHQVQYWSEEAKLTISRAPGHVLKLIGTTALDYDQVSAWRRARPDGILIYRPYWQYQDLDTPNVKAGQAVGEVDRISNLHVDYIEGVNETSQDIKGIEKLAKFNIQYGDSLHSMGYKYLGGSFSRGWPDLSTWHLFLPALPHMDALGLHAYGYIDSLGDLYRYKEVLDATPVKLRIPIIISEWGAVDDNANHGWLYYPGSESIMLDRLEKYAQLVASDNDILGVSTFVTGAIDPFKSFELAGCRGFETILNARYESNEESTNMPTYSVGPGIANLMSSHHDLPATSEWYPTPDFALAFGQSGALYVYIKSTNSNFYFPPAS